MRVGDLYMSCKTPLKGFIIHDKKYSIDNKYKIKITNYKVHHLELIKNNIVAAYDDWSSRHATTIYRDYMEIPCGKCLACQLDYAREWASRCILEAQMHESSCFLTLTYDEEHVKLSANENGGLTMTLIKKDMQDFMKRLRRYLEYNGQNNKIRFFGCGEYGSHSKRPHYHIIIFGWMPVDLVFYKFSHDHRPMYNSATLDKIWKKGFSVVGDVTFESAGYVARYVTKKMKNEGNTAIYDQYNIEPEFVLMSRMRGIGYPWYVANFRPEMFDDPYIHISSDKGGRKILIPRYIFKCAAEQYPDLYERFLEQRAESAIVSAAVKDSLTELPREEMLRRDLEVLEAKAQSLVRLL